MSSLLPHDHLPPGRLANLESNVCLRANRVCSRAFTRTGFELVSRLGDGVFWYLLMLMLILLDGFAGILAAAHMAITGALALVLYRVIKHFTKRPRPFAADVRIQAWVAPLDEFSFPSGHTLHAVAFSIVGIAHYPMLAWLLVPFTTVVAISRVVLGLHYPSDVLAAILVGSGLGMLAIWLSSFLGTGMLI